MIKTCIIIILTAYSPQVSQTDSDPFIAAWNNPVKECTIAVSRDLLGELPNGKLVELQGVKHCPLSVYTVNDVMHKRKRYQADVFFFNTQKAIEFGYQRARLCY